MKNILNIVKIPLSIYHYYHGSIVLPYLPGAIWIEPTNVCNLRCIMCPNSIIKQKNPGFMDMNVYKKIIDEVESFASFVILCISGETLLHPKFTEMVKYAKDNGLAVYLSTNATVLTPKLSREILTAGLDWINFSFDGCSKEIYERIRVNADLDKTLKNIINFLKIKKELKSKTQAELQILVMDTEGEESYQKNIEKFAGNFKGLPLDYIQKRKPSTWGGFLSGTKKFVPKSLGDQFSHCSYLWSSLHILWDGRVVACTSDFFGINVLGKFPEKTLKEIWNDQPMQKFRGAMVNKKYLKYNQNCQNCDSLWEPKTLGLPAGIRGISAIVVSLSLGKNFLAIFKKVARLFNPNFSMKVISR